ncbi:MAG: SDR family oxidoreductase [Spirochaetes bacterium]|nr:SDR family oxidoreductase [Spirochaetota bacterium]
METTINRAVLVSGASTGIGRATSIYLRRLGFHVFAGEIKLSALTAEAGPHLVPIHLDITNQRHIDRAVRTVRAWIAKTGGQLVGLVNNAGIAVSGPVEFVPIDEMRRQFEVNFLGHLAMIQAFLPLLRQSRGRIVNVGSMAGEAPFPFLSPYCASKYAIRALTDSLRVELEPYDIQLTLIEPGFVKTEFVNTSVTTGTRLFDTMPAEAERMYGDAFRSVIQNFEILARKGFTADTVARAIARNLTARRPRRSQVVGFDAKFLIFMRSISASLGDNLVKLQMGLRRIYAAKAAESRRRQ